jgi:hypothetical protein
VVSPEHERQIAVSRGAFDERCDPRPRLLDLRQEAGTFVLDLGRFRNGRFDVAEIDGLVADLSQTRLEPRVADRGRAHVHTATTRAEIERGADHGDFVNRWLHGWGDKANFPGWLPRQGEAGPFMSCSPTTTAPSSSR